MQRVNEVASRLLDDYDTKVVFYQWSEKAWIRSAASVACAVLTAATLVDIIRVDSGSM